MKITLIYLQANAVKPEVVELKPEEYFDPLEKGENYWEDGIDKNISLQDYLPIDESQVKWFRITKEFNGMKRTYTYQLLGHDCSMSIHTADEFGNEEIITQSKIAPKTWHTIRTIKPYNGQWSTYMDTIGSDEMVDGKYRNESLIKNWTFNETKEFSNIGGKDY